MAYIFMKNQFAFILLMLLSQLSWAQESHVKWSQSACQIDDQKFELSFTAKMDEGWHVYAADLPSDEGPLPTTFTFTNDSGNYRLVGKMKEPQVEAIYDPNFDLDVKYHEGEVSFKQTIQWIGSGEPSEVLLEVEYMVCNEEMCMPGGPDEMTINLANAPPCDNPSDASSALQGALWQLLLAGFGFGLLAIFTPCVLPMIPLTVSFFLKRNASKAKGIKDAIIFGVSIIVIYTSLILVVTAIWGPEAVYNIATNPYVNLGFFALFIVFAVSFLGAFEIRLPNNWINKADQASDKKGLAGIFFMAVTLALVSFTCVGLFLGAILSTATISGWAPTISMIGFGAGLAFPFVLFALFPSWLNNLPKSGGWMNNLKVVLGLLELGFAVKFLSNADLVWQWHLVTREVFIAWWIGIDIVLALYLLGTFRLSHDSPEQKINAFRVFLGVSSIAAAFYLLPGLWGAPLKLISGFPPPEFYSESAGMTGIGISNNASSSENHQVIENHCPHNLDCLHDYDEAVERAKEVQKPILLDFTGWSCANCRRIEANVWSDPEILDMLQNEVVIASLYCDDRTKLPEGGEHKTIGQKWRAFQNEKFGLLAQPFYAVVDHEGDVISIKGIGYQAANSISDYKAWLRAGIDAFVPHTAIEVNPPAESEPTNVESVFSSPQVNIPSTPVIEAGPVDESPAIEGSQTPPPSPWGNAGSAFD